MELFKEQKWPRENEARRAYLVYARHDADHQLVGQHFAILAECLLSLQLRLILNVEPVSLGIWLKFDPKNC